MDRKTKKINANYKPNRNYINVTPYCSYKKCGCLGEITGKSTTIINIGTM